MKQKLLFFTFFTFFFAFSQDVFEVKGKIVSQSSSLQDVNIFNKASAKGTYSDELGNFSIKAAVNDTLIFSAIHLQTFQCVVTKKDTVASTILYIPMESNVKELNELTLIDYKSITTEKLGIVPKGIKIKTPAERRLAFANSSGPLMSLIYAINGEKKRLEKQLEVEKKITFIEELKLDYDLEFVNKKMKLPQEYVEGFYFYLSENSVFKNSYYKLDEIQREFELSKLAVAYLELITLDNKKNE